MNYNRYEPDWGLATELGIDPEATYDEIRDHFNKYIEKGLLETVPARPGQTEPRYRFTADLFWDFHLFNIRGQGSEADFWKKVRLDEFPINGSVLKMLGAFEGAALSVYDYGELEWEQPLWPFPVKPV